MRSRPEFLTINYKPLKQKTVNVLRGKPWLTLLILTGWLTLSGCSLLPKQVEFFQKRVKPVPAQTIQHSELERQAIAQAATLAREAEAQAKNDGSLAWFPAAKSAEVSESLGRSMGPPVSKWDGTTAGLVDKLDKATAQLNQKIDSYRSEVRQVEGKKIEGTGLLQIPYFVWLGVVVGGVLLVFLVLRTVLQAAAIGNPGAALGLTALRAGGKVVSKGFAAIVRGGERFKARVGEISNDPKVQAKILEVFRIEQERAQDSDVKQMVDHLTE